MSLNLLLLVAAIAAISIVGSSVGFGQRNIPSGVRFLAETGTPFIFVGVLIGPHGLDLVPQNILEQLSPVMIIGFGWIGFLYGSHFEWRKMKRFKPRMYAAGFTESLFTLVLVTGVAWFAVPLVAETAEGGTRLAVALALGVTAAGTGPAGVFSLSRESKLPRRDVELLRFFSAVDDLPAVLMLGVLFATFYPQVAEAVMHPALRLGFEVLVGAVFGWVTHWLLPSSRDSRHSALIILGMASLCAGSAEMLELSPIFVAVIGGVVFANISPRKENVYGLMAAREHTLYVVFLIVAGTVFDLDAGRVLFVLVPGYVLVRSAGKVVGTRLGLERVLAESSTNRFLGAGLFSQGGMAIAMAVHFEHAGTLAGAHVFLSMFIWAVILNDFIGIPVAQYALQRGRSE